jgi:hypothetical protein
MNSDKSDTYENQNLATLPEDAQGCVNNVGTCEPSDTGLPQPRSLDVLFSDLTALRLRHGAKTVKGLRCSNIMEGLDNLPPGPEGRIEYLTSDATIEQRRHLLAYIKNQMVDLAA